MHLQRLGEIVTDPKGNKKYLIPRGPPVDKLCKFCHHPHNFGGPFWLDPIHDIDFVNRLRKTIEANGTYGTFDRMQGMLAVVSEELPDVPFYLVQDRLCSIMKVLVGKSTHFRSAILNAGYRELFKYLKLNLLKENNLNPVTVRFFKKRKKKKLKRMNPISLL